ncbi:endonuclease domain-containing protein [Arthrobacter woluwensis]|uniref:endonuclease domain-containing protein n=1 Tax=Arthrobacter woluwensis TaxID=156980 RepID=UPI0021BD0E1D|nr:hypothetical protein [Arthrobacter woluwensis]
MEQSIGGVDNLTHHGRIRCLMWFMTVKRPLPGMEPTGPFGTRAAANSGYSTRVLRRLEAQCLGKGVWSWSLAEVNGVPEGLSGTALARWIAPFLETNQGVAASLWTAARLWELPVWDRGDRRIHVLRPDSAADLTRPFVEAHRARLLPGEVCWFGGVPVTTPARTWLDLAAVVTLDELVAVGDACVRIPRPEFEPRKGPHATPEELRAVVRGHRGKRGISSARAALELVRVGADSPQETLLRLAFERAGFPEPLLNPRVAVSGTGEEFQPDLAFPEYRIGVEYDGEHHSAAAQVGRDIRRAEKYARAGWLEVRLSKEHTVDDHRLAIRKVRDALISRGWRKAA